MTGSDLVQTILCTTGFGPCLISHKANFCAAGNAGDIVWLATVNAESAAVLHGRIFSTFPLAFGVVAA